MQGLLPPVQSFASDNTSGAHPLVLEALQAANAGGTPPYGEDPWTARASVMLRELFGTGAEIFFTFGGTGANVVALQSLLAPYEGVICPANAHLNVDECGAPERFAGAKLLDVQVPDGKLRAEDLRAVVHPGHGEHNVKPRVLAVSQCTELGTVYTVGELTELCELAHDLGLVVYVDGARLANAVAALGCSVRELTYEAGVDVLSFGGTKNGLLYGEALVFLRPDLARTAKYARKQFGQLASKMRFIAAQFEALLSDGLWLRNADNANGMTRLLERELAGVPGVEVAYPVETNSIFARLPAAAARQLQEWSFFWDWPGAPGLVRWMTNFATEEEDVRRFSAGARYFTDRAREQPAPGQPAPG